MTFRGVVYKPVGRWRLPLGAYGYFEKHTRDIIKNDFTCLGDFQDLPWPLASYSRCFRHASGQSIAEISFARDYLMLVAGSLLDWGAHKSISFATVMSDGRFVETSNHHPADVPGETEPESMLLAFGPGDSIDELWVRHENTVSHYQSETGAVPLVFEEEQLREVKHYGILLMDWHLYRVGIKSRPASETPICPSPAVPVCEPANHCVIHSI